MSESPSFIDRLHSKKGRRRLEQLYGKKALPAQIKRYEKLAGDMLTLHPESELRFYSAPGRTELGGNHTDHNRGRVLCAAVNLDIAACVAARDDGQIRLLSDGFDEPIVVDLAELDPKEEEKGRTEALVRGIARSLAERGARPMGFEARLNAEVLPGSGLSSSAAVEVLLGTIMTDLANTPLSPEEIAKMGQTAENRYFGKPSGLMDQMASALGGITAIDFRDRNNPRVTRIDYDFADAGYCLAVVATGGSHANLSSAYAAIPAEMRAVASFLGGSDLRDIDPVALLARGPEIRKKLGDRAFLRALHYLGENARVEEMAEALEAGNFRAYLKLVKRSGNSSWKLLQNLSVPGKPREQSLVVALTLTKEFLGKKGVARVHGGGFAGTIQVYAPTSLFENYATFMERYFGPASVTALSVRPTGAGRVF